MTRRAAGIRQPQQRRRWSALSIIAVGVGLSIVLSGSAVAAKGLIQSNDIAKGAVKSKAIGNGAVMPWDLNRSTRMWVKATAGDAGAKGDTGATGAAGPKGETGAKGDTGPKGDTGATGATGAPGTTGAQGLPGAEGSPGADGSNGTDGTDGVLAQRSATTGLTPLLTATPPTVVVSMAVPAGNYVVWAKTQLSHTGAGDSVDCVLKADGVTIDQIAMKTLPALAAIPASLQAVTTTSPTQLSVECDVMTAGGAADFNSLIAIPTG